MRRDEFETWLRSLGCTSLVFHPAHHGDSTTVQAAADAIGLPPSEVGRIAKTLLWQEKASGAVIYVLWSGDERVRSGELSAFAKAAWSLGRLSLVPRDQVEHLSGFAPGAVPPFPRPRREAHVAWTAIIDRRLLRGPQPIFVSSFEPNGLYSLTATELVAAWAKFAGLGAIRSMPA